jgi:tetratricopeptide (TPR) repeat protein/DNA-binding CsgD family transcriptional regulator
MACCSTEHHGDAQKHFFDNKNKLHNGDYLATYPLHSPDSCIIRLKAEVPAPYQPWGCMGIWFRMPHTNIDSAFRLLELYEQHYPHDTVHAFSQIKRAEFYVEAAQFPKADSCLQDAEQISLRLHRTLDLSDVYFLLGRVAMYRNNFSESRQTFFKYLDLLNSHDTTLSQMHALAYHSIAVTYERAQQYDNMRTWINKLWSVLEHQPGESWVYQIKAQTAILNGIGYLNSQPDSSLLWAQKAELIVQKDLKLPASARLQYLFGRAYIELKRCDAALPYLLDAYRRRPSSHEAFGYYQYPLALGHAYCCTGRLDSAEILLREALPSPDTGNLAATHRWLGEVAAQKGDYQRAWDYQKISAELLKAKFTTDRINAAAETDARYEVLEQSKRVAVLEKEHQINRLRLLALALCLILLSGTGIAFYLRQRQNRKILVQRNHLLEQEKQIAKMRAHLKEQELEQSQQELLQTKDELEEAEALLNFKNQLIKTLELRLKQPHLPEDNETSFNEMRLLTKKDWILFQEKFSSQFPDFLQHLQNRYPALTPAETRLILLIKIGFDTRQIATMLGIADNSVWRSRHRLIKRMGLSSAKSLDDHIMQAM